MASTTRMPLLAVGTGLTMLLTAATARADAPGQPYGAPTPAAQEPAPAHEAHYGERDVVRAAVGARYYDELAPHGRWRYAQGQGWVWSPRLAAVGAGFRPYATSGSWVHSNQGWLFRSKYSWGWIPFHYGRWYRDASFGWSWVPGTTWAPAWVDWRHGDGHVGWAPLAPAGLTIGSSAWVFCGAADFGRPWVGRYLLPHHRWRAFYPRTVRVRRGGRLWSHGPPAAYVTRYGRAHYRRVRIHAPRHGVLARIHLDGRRVRYHRHGRVHVRRHYRPSGSRYRRAAPAYRYRRAAPAYRASVRRAAPAYRHATRRAPAYRHRRGHDDDDDQVRRRRGNAQRVHRARGLRVRHGHPSHGRRRARRSR